MIEGRYKAVTDALRTDILNKFEVFKASVSHNMTERASFIESFTQSIDEFEKQQKDFMESVKTDMRITDTKLEKMQNMINYV